MLRLSVPIQQLLTFWNSLEDTPTSVSQGEPTPGTCKPASQAESTSDIEENESQESVCHSNDDNQMAGDNEPKQAHCT